MRPIWPKLARLSEKTKYFNCIQFCECIPCSQGSFLLESVSSILYRGDNFCHFLFAFLHTKLRLKKVYSKRKEFFPFRVDSFSVGR